MRPWDSAIHSQNCKHVRNGRDNKVHTLTLCSSSGCNILTGELLVARGPTCVHNLTLTSMLTFFFEFPVFLLQSLIFFLQE